MGPEPDYIGKSFPRVDAYGKVSGETQFLPDIVLDRMVFAYPIYANVPFAKIKRVDCAKAKTIKGYIDCIFSVHIPGENQVGVIIEDQPLLADSIVRYVGDSVGLAIASTKEAAFRVAQSVRIEYKEFAPCFSIDESKAATGNFLHDSNVACRHQSIKGDIEQGFAKADLIFEADFKTPLQEHYYLEPQGCIAIPQTNNSITILGSMQCPFYVQKAVANVLGIPFSKVRVVQTPTGGAFGGKEDIPSELCARAAVAAVIVKRPVKMEYQRFDDVQLTSKRHPFQMHYKVGVSDNGKLIAADILLEENAGAYATLSSVVSYRATMQSMGPYRIPHLCAKSVSYYTNLPPNGAFRGFGSPQATFGHERMMDIIADRLGIDPLEFRLKNILEPGDSTLTGHRLTGSVGARETIVQARAASSWDDHSDNPEFSNRHRVGYGIATAHYGNCLGAAGWALDGAGVKIQIHRDGSIAVAYGLVEMGQGANTVVAQMTAEALGIDPSRVLVLPTDSQNVPDSGPAVASRNVVMTGNAIRDAVNKLLPILKEAAAELLECNADNIDISHDKVVDTATGNSLGFPELSDYLFISDRQMDIEGWWHVPELQFDPDSGQGEAYFTYSYATHVVKVRIDTITGLVQVEKIWAVHDVGKAINPAGIEAQVEGGTTQGIGWALMENFQMDRGTVQTLNLSTYLLPTAKDVGEVETIIVEAPEVLGPWGAKGIGEPTIIPTAAAITNAVSRVLGIQFNEIPLTPETVLDAFESRKLIV